MNRGGLQVSVEATTIGAMAMTIRVGLQCILNRVSGTQRPHARSILATRQCAIQNPTTETVMTAIHGPETHGSV